MKHRIVTAAQMKEIERAGNAHGLPYLQMMENAGLAAYTQLRARLPLGGALLIVCGKGNNGGDGLVMARAAAQDGWRVAVLLAEGDPKTPDAMTNYARLADLPVTKCRDAAALAAQPFDAVVDALYGTGFHGSLRPAGLAACALMNRQRESGAFVLAIDLPSGVSADSAEAAPGTPAADVTLTMTAEKVGCAAPECGRVEVLDIGIPASIVETVLGQEAPPAPAGAAWITEEYVRQRIRPRPADSHKGTFGSVLAVAGSAFYRGAALLAAEGALRTGAGIVTLASVEPVVSAAAARLPECCLCPCRAGAEGGISPENVPLLRRQKATVLLLGPGLGGTAQSAARAAETQALVQQLLPGFAGSAVLDADGLNAAARLLAEGAAFPHPAGELIVTPHPGEMARLTGLSASQINADREGTALRYAQAWNAVVVLKGTRTVVAAPDGRVCVNPTGNPGLSRGGSGDVLAGMTAALLACRLPAYEAAACAVYLHGAAADRAAAVHGEYGMLPHDILPELGRMFAEHQR